jgi:hypothetical protein
VRYGDQSGNGDAFNFGPDAENVVIDHVSVSWGTDGTMDINDDAGPNITVRYSIISESLEYSVHPEGKHSKTMRIGRRVANLSIYGSLMAHGRERHPNINTGVEFINNLIYNYGKYGARCLEQEGGADITLIGNHYVHGPDNIDSDIMSCSRVGCDNSTIFMSDNKENDTIPNSQWDEGTCVPVSARASSPPARSDVKAMSVSFVKDHVLSNVGARPADRDAVDKRIVNDVINGTGRIIDSQNDVGGWPVLATNYRALTIPGNPNGDDDGDGYTNLEEWLHAFAPEVEGDGGGPIDDPITKVPNPPTNLKIIN